MIRSDLVRGVLRLQQTVGLTPSEFRAALLLAGLLFTGILARHWFEQPPEYDASTYSALQAAFSARAAEIAAADTNEFPRRDSLSAVSIDSTTPELPRNPGRSPRRLAAPTPARPLDLNTAGADALISLPRIGPAIAGRIIAFRTEHGPFRYVEDLLMVRGIGEKTLEGLRDLVTVRPPERPLSASPDSANTGPDS